MTDWLDAMHDEAPEHYPLPASVDEVLDSEPRGLPRPINATLGLPIPWIANPTDLSDANAFRRAACVVMKLCQVCGDPLGPTAMVCWRPGDAFVIDGAAIHPLRCWPLARIKCPELARLIEAGILRCAQVPTGSLVTEMGDTRAALKGMPLGYVVPR